MLKLNGRKITIAVEGNIGSQKSALVTVCGLLPYIYAELEPVEEWKRVTYKGSDYNLLRSIYHDRSQNFLALQVLIATTLSTVYNKPFEKRIWICERQLESAKCFIQAGNYDHQDMAVLYELHQHLATQGTMSPDIVIYLVASPRICLKRIQSRARPEEQGVTLDYFQKVHEALEQWLGEGTPGSKPVVRFDANKPLKDVIDDVAKYLNQFEPHPAKNTPPSP